MDAFIARQPVFDDKLEVQAYELLFRSGLENACTHHDLDQASSKVIADSLFLPGLETLTCGRAAFVNITRDLLVREDVSLLPPATTVLEILESVAADDEVRAACRRLKERGYRLALDDFRADAPHRGLLDVADIVKVDVLVSGPAERRALARQLIPRGLVMLAEKVESEEVFRQTRDAGYTLFQGYFFARPTIVRGRDIPGSKLSFLRILGEIHKPDLDLAALGAIVEREVTLSYKLLRYINSAFFGWNGDVSSIGHALMLLGEREIKRWASVIALAGMSSDKPGELQAQALMRGRFCELLAPGAGQADRSSDLFLLGLFSLMDAMLDHPLDKVLDGLPLAQDVKDAMLGGAGPLRDVFDVVLAYSQGDWEALRSPVERLGLDEVELPEIYVEALRWSGQSDAGAVLSMAA